MALSIYLYLSAVRLSEIYNKERAIMITELTSLKTAVSKLETQESQGFSLSPKVEV